MIKGWTTTWTNSAFVHTCAYMYYFIGGPVRVYTYHHIYMVSWYSTVRELRLYLIYRTFLNTSIQYEVTTFTLITQIIYLSVRQLYGLLWVNHWYCHLNVDVPWNQVRNICYILLWNRVLSENSCNWVIDCPTDHEMDETGFSSLDKVNWTN